MSFKSIAFLIFLPTVLTVFYLIPGRFRIALLLITSLLFYGTGHPEYLILLGISIVLDYYCSKAIYHSTSPQKQKLFLVITLLLNLGMLVVFKYFNFLFYSITEPSKILVFNAYQAENWILPAGISFYTFQSLSYTIDVYRKKIVPEKSIFNYALYVSFFPQLVAGPIERYGHLMPRLKSVGKIRFVAENFQIGIKWIIWGFFKKLVIADRIAPMVNKAFSDVPGYHGWEWLLIGFLFLVQIYTDFSGYTDIARGTARLFGIDLMINWLRPFYSNSVKNFWRNWHISLTTWFKDYVYHPLGGNKTGKLRMAFSILLVFFLSGLWHGANFTFIIWGVLNGLWVLLELALNPLFRRIRFPAVIRWAYVILIQSLFFLAFRASSLSDLLLIANELATFSGCSIKVLNNFGVGFYSGYLTMAFVGLLFMKEWLERKPTKKLLKRLRPVFYFCITIFIFVFGEFGTNEFIYFQF